MTADELFAAFCKAKGKTPYTLHEYIRAALAKLPDRLPIDMTGKLSDADWLVAYHLVNVEVEAMSEAKSLSRGMGFSNLEGTYRDSAELGLELVARLARSLPDQRRNYAQVYQLGRENKHDLAALVMATFNSNSTTKDTIDADAVAALADQIKRKVGR